MSKTRDKDGYGLLLGDVVQLLAAARHLSARAVNALMTATYWHVGRRIVEFEQGGKERAAYGEQLLRRLSADLTARFGRGYSRQNLQQIRLFYLAYDVAKICQTLSGKLEGRAKSQTVSSISGVGAIPRTLFPESEIFQTPPRKSATLSRKSANRYLSALAQAFPLPWSAYVRLLSVKSTEARAFYETEALRGGWSVRQLDRQIASQFYERTALSRDKAAMLAKGARRKAANSVTPEEELKDPYMLEFLGLKDEYSETDLEEGLIHHLESFLLELGGDFAFIGRQKRLRVGHEWYRLDLLFFHRRLRCLIVIDLKVGKFTHADAGQMHLYLNYVREHWMREGENPPVGLILCAEKDSAVARYALEGLPNKVLAAEYKIVLPAEKTLAAEIEQTRKLLDARKT